MDTLIAVVAIGVLILVHEAGHFALARAFGMRAEVFSIGFGPPLLSLKGKRTEYRLSILPLGGYVRIAGMTPGEETGEEDAASFSNKPLWQRFLVLFAGPFTNWLFAFLLLAALMVGGLERPSPEPVIGKVKDGTPAATAGLHPGDRVLSVDGQPIASWKELVAAIGAHRGQPMELKLARRDEELRLTPTVGASGRLGVVPSTVVERYALGKALGLAFVQTGQIVSANLAGLWEALRGRGEAQLIGPVGIVGETVEAVRASPSTLALMLVMISLALSLMNLLPLPALDGGRLLFIGIAAIRKRPVSASVEAAIHAAGFVLLLGLILWATWGDIARRVKRSEPASAPAPTAPAPAPAPSKP